MIDLFLEIKKFISKSWENIFAEVCNAVVYIDHSAIECLHWYTAGKGYLILKDAGAVAVYEFGMYHFRYTQVKDVKKAVIISTSGDPAFYQRTIKMILAKNVFENCIVFSGAPCCTTINHSGTLTAEEKLSYVKLKKDIKTWMASGNLSQEPTVDIVYAPIFLALLNKHLLVTPPFGDLMPPLDADIPRDTFIKSNLLAYSFCNHVKVYFLMFRLIRSAPALVKYCLYIVCVVIYGTEPDVVIAFNCIPYIIRLETRSTKIQRGFPREVFWYKKRLIILENSGCSYRKID